MKKRLNNIKNYAKEKAAVARQKIEIVDRHAEDYMDVMIWLLIIGAILIVSYHSQLIWNAFSEIVTASAASADGIFNFIMNVNYGQALIVIKNLLVEIAQDKVTAYIIEAAFAIAICIDIIYTNAIYSREKRQRENAIAAMKDDNFLEM